MTASPTSWSEFLDCGPHRRRRPLRGAGHLAYCIPVMSTSDHSVRRVRPRARNRPLPAKSAAAPYPALVSINDTPSFKNKAYTALKNAIVAMDIYRSRDDIRLDERKLALD